MGRDPAMADAECRVNEKPASTMRECSTKKVPLSFHRLGVVKPAVIDRESAVAVVGINLHETLAEPNVAPGVILLSLDWRRNDWIDRRRPMRSRQPGLPRAIRASRRRAGYVRRSHAVTSVRRETRKPIELEFQAVKVAEVTAFHERLIAIEHDSEFGLDHAVLVQIANAQHEGGLAVQGRDDD